MTRKESKILRKFRNCSKVDKICILIFLIAAIIGTIVGVYLGYDTAHQEPLTQKEIDEMYNIAVFAKESELLIDDNYIITISNDEISVETCDDCKGILKMDLANNGCNYEIEYRYNVLITAYTIVAYSIVFFAIIYVFVTIIFALILFISSKIKRVKKK